MEKVKDNMAKVKDNMAKVKADIILSISQM
jgi:hypothetical protein